MKKVILLDRDGVINQDSFDYIKSPDEFIIIPGSMEAIARLHAAGYQLGIATNQSGVSRTYYSEQVLLSIHQKMMKAINAAGGDIAAIEYCVHLPSEDCSCRKPQPGMLIRLAERLDCDLTDVPFVGDRVSDIQAALAVGAKPVMVLSQMTDRIGLANYPQVPVYHSLAEWVDHWLQHNE